MKVDSYTKTVLTVICLCLVYLCLKSAFTIPKVHADAPLRVVLVDGSDRPLTDFGSTVTVPVHIEGPVMLGPGQ